jgi:dipeptidyl aminopeptidase/acylaminoacyl peptidase
MKNSLLLLLNLVPAYAHAQNGKILSQKPVVYSDSLVFAVGRVKAQRIRSSPRFREVFEQTETLAIVYRSGGLKIEGFVMQPKKPGQYPCVIFCRGGHEDFSQIDVAYTSVLADMANHGYVVIASQLRGTPGSQGKDEFGGADTLDVINCIPALNHFSKADTSRIGLYGISRGGMNALQVLRTQKSLLIAAGE